MSLSAATVLYNLAEKANQIDNVQELTLILQQQFVELFRGGEMPSSPSKPKASSLASTEEEKLLAVRAVEAFHSVGLQRHGVLFQSDSYHTNAAFFIHELLASLSGSRRIWFQKLQKASLHACVAVVKAIGCRNTRLCLPGIVSACVHYIDRAHHGTDTVAVRTGAVELLRVSLKASLVSQGDDTQWLQSTVGHLGHSMTRLLDPSRLALGAKTLPFAQSLLHLTTDLLLLPSLGTFLDTPFMREVTVGWFVLSNVNFLLSGGVFGGATDSTTQIPSGFFQERAVVELLQAQLKKLRGVELLHFSSALLRCKDTRATAFPVEDHNQHLMQRVLQRCIQVVGTEMSVEDLYSAKVSRSYPCIVGDTFIECAAYAVTATTTTTTTSEDPAGCVTVGEQVLKDFMAECEATLADWDLYMLHPPTIYVLTRLVLWQFRTPAWVTEEEEKGRPAEEFILSDTFEQLWSIVAQPHLWNITEDENLCSYQQLRHRQTVAATILCFLEIAAGLLRDEPVIHRAKRKRAVQRLNLLVLYIVLEKATGPTFVRDAAMGVMKALGEAGFYPDTLAFFLSQSGYIVDEAARAFTEEDLRVSAASVLRGGVSFLQSKLLPVPGKEEFTAITSRQGVDVPRGRNPAAVVLVTSAIPKVSDFVSSAVKVASDGCRRSTLQEETAGARASVALLLDCFSVSAALNRSVPQLGIHEDQDCMTTAAEPRVQILQLAVLEAVQMLLAYCTRNDAVAPLAISAVTRGLTVFLTTPRAETWINETESDGDQPPPVFEWEDNAPAVLPRNHLRTVYQVYLSFLAILAEPVSGFSTTSNSKRLSAQERRVLEAVQPTPAVIAAMEGLKALFALATDFLSRRVVEEVLPVVFTWHERGALPRIPTKTDERLQTAAKKFLQDACVIDPSLEKQLHAECAFLLPPLASVSAAIAEES
ncbi:hypothetical protein TCDM_07761 [Trypanosoma cruzi Dm28c]|uniref:Uncharacterized protein n=2 Tax=Trypanosoma cruzi TaxID=5693 RepID=V5ATV9_TRYCR|nr:hypothetical protein TCDM_07761 [Trypanosoma cruzi Dm28c]PBJ78098.1 hypothetical protein BCY84_05169 [Trypanosoma cruzi cruzi]PWU90337.1 hypothetical protein C4B63_51g176 [Trypanosoma cruzi]